MKEHSHEKSVQVWRNLGLILCMMNTKIYQLAFGKDEEKCNFYCDPSKVFAR